MLFIPICHVKSKRFTQLHCKNVLCCGNYSILLAAEQFASILLFFGLQYLNCSRINSMIKRKHFKLIKNDKNICQHFCSCAFFRTGKKSPILDQFLRTILFGFTLKCYFHAIQSIFPVKKMSHKLLYHLLILEHIIEMKEIDNSTSLVN